MPQITDLPLTNINAVRYFIRCVNIDINVQPKGFTAKGTTAADAIFKFTANFKPPPPPKKNKNLGKLLDFARKYCIIALYVFFTEG